MRLGTWGGGVLVGAMLASVAFAAEKVPAPAQKAAGRAAEAKEQAGDEQYRTTVVGKPERESDPVGEYAQPSWSTRRRFPTTRVYVLPKGGVNLDYWLVTEGRIAADSQPKYISKLEFEFGLGARLQTDFFLRFEQEGYAGPLKLAAEELELRWALADWGKLPGNPALHFEYIRNHEKPPVLEAGVELKAAAEDETGKRFEFEEISLLAGPSFQIRPTRVLYIDVVPLAGVRLTDDETKGHYAVYLILGLELGN